MNENKDYLSKQILTYLGNKRSLLSEIERFVLLVKKRLKKEKLVTLDLFSGSGIVARMFKQHSDTVIANDLEEYSKIINECYLSNRSEFDVTLFNKYLADLSDKVKKKPINGIISTLYAPKDDNHILENERAFYTHENAIIIDSYRNYIDKLVPHKFQKYFLAQLLIESSIHTNTCGVFKGFYKDSKTGIGQFGGDAQNALCRIKGKIKINKPVLSNFNSRYKVYKLDAVALSKQISGIDLAYLDPPYNQHPYGSNYFMLNLIIKNKAPKKTSEISGIVEGWNHSAFNNKKMALEELEKIVVNLDSKYILISYNNEGFITYQSMMEMLRKHGKVSVKRVKYNTFRGSHNLNSRSIYTNEYLFLINKEKKHVR